MLHLRPHHLLCLLFYEGKGYSADFVENMDNIVNFLEQNKDVSIYLKNSCDSICIYCPYCKSNDQCTSFDKVKLLDQKVLEVFRLKNNTYYPYQYLTSQIQKKLNAQIFKQICSVCQWYKMGVCKEEKIKKAFEKSS